MVVFSRLEALGVFAAVAAVITPPCDGWKTPSTRRFMPSLTTFRRTTTPLLRRPPSTRLFSSFDDDDDKEREDASIGLNELQTMLRKRMVEQDFVECILLSNMLMDRLYEARGSAVLPSEMNDADRERARRRMTWEGLGTAPWLEDRLDALNFTLPTTIQMNALEAVNAILLGDAYETDAYDLSETLEERVSAANAQETKDMGVVISGSTGSGKTLAFLVPILSALSDSLFVRQRLRVGAEEKLVGDTTEDMLGRVLAVTSPELRSPGARGKQVGGMGGAATGAALSSLGSSGKDVRHPLALIVVPTRELGIQIATLAYRLVGGTIKKSSTQRTPPKANMFRYKGPKGVKIACILDEEESEYGLKLQTDVCITTPQYLPKLLADKEINPSLLRVVALDEADLTLEKIRDDALESLLNDDPDEREYTRLTFLVGASVTESLGNFAVSKRILPPGKSWIASATKYTPLLQEVNETTTATPADSYSDPTYLRDLDICMDPGLVHERAVIQEGSSMSGMLALTRLLRQALKDFDESNQEKSPRVVVFFPSEEEAKGAIELLRDAVWGDHKVCVLLPETGVNPIKMMEEFVDGKTSVMIATPNSVRGLDFPDLTHVYTLYLPLDDKREYVHLAGRVGRVGQMGSKEGSGGRVVSILREGEDADKMAELATELGFRFSDVEIPQVQFAVGTDEEERTGEGENVEEMRRFLEDTVTLLDTAEELEVDFSEEAERKRAAMIADMEDDDDDDDADDEFDDEEAQEKES